MTAREQIIAEAKNSSLEALFFKGANGKVWRVIDLALPELERFYAIAFEAGRNAEREACIEIVESYRVSVGNSCAGELACEWTMENLREIREAIRTRGNRK